MVDHARLRLAVSQFVRALTGRYEIGQVLYQLTDESVEVVGCAGAGVAVGDDEGRLRFVTATDERIAALEERQMADVREGPCHEAFTAGARAVSADLGEESRWPTYADLALDAGARAVLGVPLAAEGDTLGALNLYWVQPHDVSDEELESAQLLADMAAAAITNLRLLSDAKELTAQLQEALDSRVVIEQAKGIVAERRGTDSESAFELLRGHARRSRRTLHEVAAEVVEGDLEL